jgi:heme oxygenase
MTSLFERLKSDTERQHRDLEALIDPMKNFCSLDAYQTHLLKTWAFYSPMETHLAALDWSVVGIDFASRRKTPLLEQDLHVLGIPFHEGEDAKRPLDRTDIHFALGCLYVLEGATLGGQVISRHLAKLGIGPENGGLFFNGYGAKTGEMWKSFKTSATSYCVTEDQMSEAINGAKATFGRFRESMVARQETISHVA